MKWKLEKRKISELINNERNPRKLSKFDADHLTTSIEKFGLCEPVVANINGNIIGGHQRIRTLTKLGHTEVDTYIPICPLSPEEEDELNIRLNKNTGEFDIDILANQWELEDLLDWGFTQEELQLEEVPMLDGDDRKTQKCTMNITFQCVDHLQEAENRIAVIVDEYEGATHKVKIK